MKDLLSHREVDYKISRSSIRRCGNCSMYVDKELELPKCTLVESPILPSFVCMYFNPRKREDQRAA